MSDAVGVHIPIAQAVAAGLPGFWDQAGAREKARRIALSPPAEAVSVGGLFRVPESECHFAIWCFTKIGAERMRDAVRAPWLELDALSATLGPYVPVSGTEQEALE